MSAGTIDFNQASVAPVIDLICGMFAERSESDVAFIFRGKPFAYFVTFNGQTAPDGFEIMLGEIEAMPEDNGPDPELKEIVAVFWSDADGYLMMGEVENAVLSKEAKVLFDGFTFHVKENADA